MPLDRAPAGEPSRRPAPRAGRAAPAPAARPVLGLQRAAGNAAVSAMLATGAPARPAAVAAAARAGAVQRHSSWEHALLGDTPPSRLGDAAVTRGARAHLLAEQWERMMFFSRDPGADPRARFPGIRWVQFRASGLWASYGELNALADYLPDPQAYDTLPRETMVPVLQRMRSGIRKVTGAEFGLRGRRMEGMAPGSVPLSIVSEAADELKAMDEATAGLGTNRYAALVARNACHFAPFSWQRWALYHNEARQEAIEHHARKTETAPISNVDTSMEEHLRQSVLKNGYADHFIQDSFAAGHLVNKTLVMQWFADYLNGLSWYARPWFGLPGGDVLRRMGSAAQPGIAGRALYGRPPPAGTSSAADRMFGTGATDPQTAQERVTRTGRVRGSGVVGANAAEREANYQAYLTFLNSAFMQKAAGAAHDYFNQRGLTVVNAAGTRMRVGGDDTLLSESNRIGAETAGEAARLSRQAVDELANTGATAITVEQIFRLVPQSVVVTGANGSVRTVPLDQWQDTVLRRLCFDQLFPELVETLSDSTIVRAFGSEMVSGGVSVDAGVPPPPQGPVGDFPATTGSGSSRTG